MEKRGREEGSKQGEIQMAFFAGMCKRGRRDGLTARSFYTRLLDGVRCGALAMAEEEEENEEAAGTIAGRLLKGNHDV